LFDPGQQTQINNAMNLQHSHIPQYFALYLNLQYFFFILKIHDTSRFEVRLVTHGRENYHSTKFYEIRDSEVHPIQ